MASVLAHLTLWAVMPQPRAVREPGRVLSFRLVETREPAPVEAPAVEQPGEVEPHDTIPTPFSRSRIRRPLPRAAETAPDPADPDPDFDALLDGLLHPPDVGLDPSVIFGEESGATDGALREAGGLRGAAPSSGERRDHRCADPIAGTWRARRYDPERVGWVVVTLYIQRASARLSGSIQTHSWSGDRDAATPELCSPGVRETRTILDGRGRYWGGRFRFDGTHARENAICGDEGQGVSLEHASGVVRQGVMTITGDDGRPLRLRRFECANTAEASRIRRTMAEMGL